MNQHDFTEALRKDGFDTITTVSREANGALDVHVHPFEAKALVIDGSLQIDTGEIEHRYNVGDIFHLQANQPHSERYGPIGVTYVVGRK